MSWDDGTHLLRQAAPPGPAGPPGLPGEKGDDVLGFHLTSDCNYDLQNKKVYYLDTPDDRKVDDDYNTIAKDLKSAVNKEYLNDNFFKKDREGYYFDLKQKVIKNTEPYYGGFCHYRFNYIQPTRMMLLLQILAASVVSIVR